MNFKPANIPSNDALRVKAVQRTGVLDESKEELYDIYCFLAKEITGCPILVNTSFNVRGEPIVNTPEDAFNCFMGTELDKLVIVNCYLDKKDQNKSLKKDYSKEFELD